MHISHDLIATKACLSYAFLVVLRTGVGLRPKKYRAGRAQVGMVCGAGHVRVRSVWQVRAKFLKLLWVQGGAGLNFADAGQVWTQNFNPRRTLVAIAFPYRLCLLHHIGYIPPPS